VLQQIPASKGSYAPAFDARDGAVPSMTRAQVADDAGMSEHQRRTALPVLAAPTELALGKQ